MAAKSYPKNLVAFDLEIAKILPGDFSQWRAYRPLGITCAAMVFNGHDPILWYSKQDDGTIAGKMSQKDLIRLVEYLEAAVAKGWKIVTWNGLGFDFDVLAEESGCWDACRALALDHIDLMFHILCAKGYPLALDKAAKGMGLSGKAEGMSGELAPVLWRHGEFRKVLDYVAQDATITLGVAKAGNKAGEIAWTSNRGSRRQVKLPHGWLTVRQASGLPSPDTSWMSNPMSRTEFIGWTSTPIAPNTVQPTKPSPAPEQTPLKNQESSPFVEIIPEEHWFIDTLEAAFLNSVGFSADNLQFGSQVIQELDIVMGCPCPICQGTPNLDPIFLYLEDDQIYDNLKYEYDWDDY